MNHRGAGVAFCGIAALLRVSWYLSAAVFGSGVSTWNKELFQAMLQYMGNELRYASIMSLAMGIGYLVFAEISQMRGKNQQE